MTTDRQRITTPLAALLLLLTVCIPAAATAETTADSLAIEAPAASTARKPFLQRMIAPFAHFFLDTDTAYITPSEYNFQALEQVKYNYETYRIKSPDGIAIGFSPRKSLKIGPYIGWSIIFIGVTVDLFHLSDDGNRKEWDLSLYTLPFVLDIYYREGGSRATINYLRLDNDIDTKPAIGMPFDEFNSDIYGFDFTYIFNHKKFSYPAAFNQGVPQRRSAGSFLAGIGFTQHALSIDWDALIDNLEVALGPTFNGAMLDTLRFDKITYSDLSLSGGYAYNFVFARHWLLAASLAIGVSYKYAAANKSYIDDFGETIRSFRDFKFSDISFDLTGRFGIVYNNGRWFIGASAIIHSYNYSTTRFNANSNFGTVNLYGGINFGKKKQYKTKKI